MTSGVFRPWPVSGVIVNRDERQRKVLTGIEELAESLRRVGQINPIVITRDGVLVAGERRLTASKMIGWTDIMVQFVEDLDEYELAIIELEENIKRVDLTWQDQCLALEKFHKLKKETEEDWTQDATALALGMTSPEVSEKLVVAKEILNGNDRIATADKFSMARNLVRRDQERKRSAVLDNIIPATVTQTAVEAEVEEESAPPPAKIIPLINEDFHEWAAAYCDTKFNLIHCDFPYGINVADSPRQNSGIQEYYEDSKDVYFALLDTLEMAMSNVVSESAHLIFWFSMDYYQITMERLTKMGWKVNPFPLIWHKSDNAGIAPDPQRGPRRTYETAFFASRGDRKLTEAGAVSNSFAFPGKKGPDGIHLSEKPVAMLQHFLRMVCDDYSAVLDPTCGSGNALKAAGNLSAARVLGIEKSKDFYETAVAKWETVLPNSSL